MPSATAVIDKLAYGGNGVCRIEGKVCFVPFSCPGDQLRLRLTSQKKSYSLAEISEILRPSAARTLPPCPIFGVCGGCSWQHVQYPLQLEQKKQIFAETLWRGARVPLELIADTVASPLHYGYRSRVQFKVSFIGGRLRIGFYRTGTHVVEDAGQGCPIAMPFINEILGCFRSILTDYNDPGCVDQISIDAGVQGAVAIVHCSDSALSGLRTFLKERISELESCSGLFLQSGRKAGLEKVWGNDEISYFMPQLNPDLAPYSLSYSPGGFAQINQAQNVAILSIIRTFADFRSTDRLLDLYCGNGNFTIPLAGQVASALGVEGSELSIRSANANKTCNAVHNVQFVCNDVKIALQELVSAGQRFDVVLLDPPRNGAGEVVADIAELAPFKIIYVSCDPSTLARDCGLLAGHGYRVVRSVPLDMFPQTYHLESVTLLIKE